MDYSFSNRRRPATREQTLLGSDPTCVPPVTAHRPRTLVLCFDGTGDHFDNDISNIATIFSMLKKDDSSLQMCYYQAGIGTYLNHHLTIPGAATMKKTVDQAIALYLSAHVKEGYEFLMQNYIAGDKICLFGFSRGAYTARALAGMLHKVGLLPKDNRQQIPFAWRMYKDTSENGWKLSHQFLQSFCTRVTISFLGVFDTVSSVGLIGKGLPFTSSNKSIRHFRHAMALDERRARFKVNHWDWAGARNIDVNTRVDDPDDADGSPSEQWAGKSVRKGHQRVGEPQWETDVKEVWFAGGHADVGGGNVLNFTPMSLSRIPLRWMVKETFRCGTGILWDIDGLKRIGLKIEFVWPDTISPSILSEDSVFSGKAGRKRTGSLTSSWTESPTIFSSSSSDWLPPLPTSLAPESKLTKHGNFARTPTIHRNKSSPSLALSPKEIPLPPPPPIPPRSEKRLRSVSASHPDARGVQARITPLVVGSGLNRRAALSPDSRRNSRRSSSSRSLAAIEANESVMSKRSRSCSTSRTTPCSSKNSSPTSSLGSENSSASRFEYDFTSPFTYGNGIPDETSEQDPDDIDVLSPLYDQLKLAKLWWLLELCPTKGKKQVGSRPGAELRSEQSDELSSAEEYEQSDNRSSVKAFFGWKDHYFINLGRGRAVPHSPQGMLVHKSVKTRMEKMKDYLPRALVPVRAMENRNGEWEEGKGWNVVWVD